MGERILLVEDDPRLAEMLSEHLGQAGLRVATGGEARCALQDGGSRFIVSLPAE